MAISTNGTVITRLAGALYGENLSNGSYLEVSATAPATVAANWLSSDFASKTDTQVATTVLTNLNLSSVEGLSNWLAAQLTAAGSSSAAKGAKLVSLLNDFSQMTADAVYGASAVSFNSKVAASLTLQQTAGYKGGSFSTSDAVPAVSVSLTSGIDALTGTAQNDTFSATQATLTPNDVIRGGDGQDTLQITDSGSTPWTMTSAVTIDSIETVKITNINGTGATGTAAVTEKADVVFRDLGPAQTLSIGGLIVTAGSSGAAAKDVATAFATLATAGGASTSGTLASWTIAANPTNPNAVVVTSTTATANVTDVAITGTAITGIPVTNQTTQVVLANASTGADSVAIQFTFNGVTVTSAVPTADTSAAHGTALANAINAYAGANIATAAATSGTVTISSPTPISLAGFASTGDTFTYSLVTAYSAAVASAAPTITLTQGSGTTASGYTAGGLDTFAAGKFVGATEFVNNISLSDVSVTGLASTQQYTIQGDNVATVGANTASWTSVASPVVNIKGGGTSGALTLSGTSTTSGTINAGSAPLTTTGTTGTNTVGAVKAWDDATAVTGSLTINADSNLTMASLSSLAKTLTVKGAGTTVLVGSSTTPVAITDANLTDIDASGLTVGGMNFVLSTSVTSFKGGQGNDTVATAAIPTTASIDAGAGTGDTLVITTSTNLDTAAEAAQYTNFEVLRTAGSFDLSLLPGITSIQTGASSANLTKLNATQAGAITLRNAGNNGSFSASLTDSTGTSDVLSLTLGRGTTTDASGNIDSGLTANGFETINLTTKPGTTATAGASQKSTVSAFTADTVTAINLKGTSFVLSNIATSKAVTIDGTALTGDRTAGATVGFTTAGSAYVGSSIKGSAYNDTYTVGAEGSTYDGGAGDDTFSLAASVLTPNGTTDTTLVGGTGNDTLTITGTGTLTDLDFTNVSGMESLSTTTTGTVSISGLAGGTKAAFATGMTVTSGLIANNYAYTFAAGIYDKPVNLTVASSGLGNDVDDNISITTGSAADTVVVTAASYVGATSSHGSITVSTGAGNDSINVSTGTLLAITSTSGVVITGGTGADAISVTHINSDTASATSGFKFVIPYGDSPVSGYDSITGFKTGDGTKGSDGLDFSSVALSSYSATVPTGFTSDTLTVAVSATGAVTFAGTSAAGLSVAQAIAAVQSVVYGGEGHSAAFVLGGDTYVFNNNSLGDSVVHLVGVTGTPDLITSIDGGIGSIFIQ
jgi:hypothetical protein